MNSTINYLGFKPDVNPINAFSGGHQVLTDDYCIVNHDTHFLGIKKVIEFPIDDNKPELGTKRDYFVINHRQAHDLAHLLFESITGNTQGNVIRYFDPEKMRWAAFLISNNELSVYDILNPEYLSFLENSYSENAHLDLLVDDKKHRSFYSFSDLIERFKSMNLVVGVNNGYGLGETPTFYVIIKLRNQRDETFLTINNYKFLPSVIEKYLQSGKDFTLLKRVIRTDAAQKFHKTLYDYTNNYKEMFGHKFTNLTEQFPRVCLDIHNLNSRETSVKNDIYLSKRIAQMSKKANLFVKRTDKRTDYALLIDFLLTYAEFDNLDEIANNRNKVEKDVFVLRNAYKILLDRVGYILSHPNILQEYLKEQISSFDKLGY